MGGRLRKLRDTYKDKELSDGKVLGAKGHLTDKFFDSLQFYYRKNIRDNPNDLEGIRKAVWSSFFHNISTDDKPSHTLCSESWCGYKKSLTDPNIDYKYKNAIPSAVADIIKPVFGDLAHPNLSKCLYSKTQNTNELLNGLF